MQDFDQANESATDFMFCTVSNFGSNNVASSIYLKNYNGRQAIILIIVMITWLSESGEQNKKITFQFRRTNSLPSISDATRRVSLLHSQTKVHLPISSQYLEIERQTQWTLSTTIPIERSCRRSSPDQYSLSRKLNLCWLRYSQLTVGGVLCDVTGALLILSCRRKARYPCRRHYSGGSELLHSSRQ